MGNCMLYALLSYGMAKRSHASIVFYSVVQKCFFRPAGATRCPDKREIWHAPPCQISRLSGQKCGNTAPKLSKFRILATNLPHRGDSFAVFLRNFQHLYASQVAFTFLVWSLSGDKRPSYKDFPAVGTFSHKFSVALSGETTNRIKKVRGCKNGTDLLYQRAKYGRDRG